MIHLPWCIIMLFRKTLEQQKLNILHDKCTQKNLPKSLKNAAKCEPLSDCRSFCIEILLERILQLDWVEVVDEFDVILDFFTFGTISNSGVVVFEEETKSCKQHLKALFCGLLFLCNVCSFSLCWPFTSLGLYFLMHFLLLSSHTEFFEPINLNSNYGEFRIILLSIMNCNVYK